jgi:hypothetical protein
VTDHKKERKSMTKKRIKHNDLTHYFLRDHSTLPQAYVTSCEKFFKSIKLEPLAWLQAPSSKPQASSNKLDKTE